MVSISEILKTFQICYESFEICSVFHNDGSIWRNVITTFYVRKEALEAPQETMVFDGENIKIIKSRLNISQIVHYLEGLKKGRIFFLGLEVQFENPFDYDKLKIREDEYAHYRQIKNARIFVFPRQYNVFNNNKLLSDHLEQIKGKVIKLGFKDAYDYISYQTGIRLYSTSFSTDFLLIIPILFSITAAKVENGILDVHLFFDDLHDDLQINVIGYSEDYRTKIFRENVVVEGKKKVSFNVDNVLPDSRFEIFLFSKSLPELQIMETVFVPISQPLLPLTQSYDQFHRLEELEVILARPETLDSRHRSDIFEKGVCDLFSLCGLSTIHLGEHEKLILDNKTEIGSADILAYDGDETLFVIDCDIKFPDPKKMENLIHLCRYLESLPKVKEVKNVIPIIVSPSPTSLTNSDVFIIDRALIQRLFKGIYYKSKKELVSMITEQYFQHQIANQRIMWR